MEKGNEVDREAHIRFIRKDIRHDKRYPSTSHLITLDPLVIPLRTTSPPTKPSAALPLLLPRTPCIPDAILITNVISLYITWHLNLLELGSLSNQGSPERSAAATRLA